MEENVLGDLACLWKDCIEVEILSLSLNHINMLVSMDNGEQKWQCTGIYGFHESHSKAKTCDLINHLAGADHDKWLTIGDFDLVLSQDEKMGGNPVNQKLVTLFRDTLQRNNLADIGFEGDQFTWNNNQNGSNDIKARLDRVVASPEWKFYYPRAILTHLVRHASDHMPLLLQLDPQKNRMKKRSILKLERFEECWLRDETLEEVVRSSWLNCNSPLCDKIPYSIKVLTRWGEVDLEKFRRISR